MSIRVRFSQKKEQIINVIVQRPKWQEYIQY